MPERPSPGVLPKPSTFISIIIYIIAFNVRTPGVLLTLVISHCFQCATPPA
jgi:hypothetical protein